MTDRFSALAAWGKTDRLTSNRVKKLTAFFGSLETAWNEISASALIEADFGKTEVESILAAMASIDAKHEAEKVLRAGAKILTPDDSSYPDALRTLSDRPEILYLRGEILATDNRAIAVVGSRIISTYGKQVVTEVVRPLARSVTIVSGLAVGVDAAAHEAALEAGGRTIAVLGNGIDAIYPPQNTRLSEKILTENGAILSEFAPGTEPAPYHFPRRNRIVSGLSLGVLVIEAKRKSGSLITAEYALEQGREVFAVPGSIFSATSGGTNHLIESGGAKLITSADEILEEFNFQKSASQSEARRIMTGTPQEEIIFSNLSTEPISIDMLCKTLAIPSAVVSGVLTMLEMKGLARDLGAGQWIKK